MNLPGRITFNPMDESEANREENSIFSYFILLHVGGVI